MKRRDIVTNSIISLVLISLSLLAFSLSPVAVSANADNKAIYKGNPLNGVVSLMINVYWGDEFIMPMLDTLDKYGVKTTFFVGGSWVAKSDNLLREIHKRGHEIGNHGYLHKDHDKINKEANIREIKMCGDIVLSTVGVNMTLFAPPSGAFNNTTLDVAADMGYKTIMWTRDTIDWRDKNAELIFTRATKNTEAGDLILMHPTKCTAEALPKILDYYKTNNIKVAPVSQTIRT